MTLPFFESQLSCSPLSNFLLALMIPTPDLSHLTASDYDKVYEPAEDTFLLLDALEEDAESLKGLSASICLEVGSGSGCVTSFIGGILGPSCTSAQILTPTPVGLKNHVDINVVNGSLLSPFETRLTRTVDVILFNPPYVPTSGEEAQDAQTLRDLGGAWAGGSDGMQITNILLSRVEALLSPTGRFYLVALKQNDIVRIIQTMQEQHCLKGEVVLQRRAGREHLFIIRFVRDAATSITVNS